MEGFLKALENGTEFDYIACHGYEMSKDELITILKEYIYSIHSMKIYDDKDDVRNTVYENLLDFVGED